jgi:hypothetical protein
MARGVEQHPMFRLGAKPLTTLMETRPETASSQRRGLICAALAGFLR